MTIGHRVIIPAGDFVEALNDVLPFAADAKTDASMAVVRVHWDGEEGLLDVQATNGSTSGLCAWSPDDDPVSDVQTDMFTEPGGGSESWQIFISSANAKAICADFKPGPKDACVLLTLGFDNDNTTLRVSRERSGDRAGKSMDITGFVDHPNFTDVLTRITPGEQSQMRTLSEIALPLWSLALFAKVRPRGGHITISFITDRLCAVSIGPRFVGAIVPIREPDPRDNVASDSGGYLRSEDHWLTGYSR